MTDHVVAKASELADGQMKNVKIGDNNILLLRVGGRFRAFGGMCPHQGAPLAEGTLHEHHVRCPWHQSLFDADTGEMLEPPTLDSLPRFDVRVEGQDVIISLPSELPRSREPDMIEPDASADGRTFVILGTGAAGLVAAQTLREDGFQGRIVMITREGHAPYDRTMLSKRYLSKDEAPDPFVRPGDFWQRQAIELQTGKDVTSIDVATKNITFIDGSSAGYDRLLLASGSLPRRLGVEGEELENVLVLRSLQSSQKIRELIQPGRAAIMIGSAFIGLEVAASLTQRGMKVHVVSPDKVPFEKAFGPRIGRMYQHVHEEKGTRFHLGQKVRYFDGDGKLKQVVLEDGTHISTDIAIVAIGVLPATDYLQGIKTNADLSVNVDLHMQAAPDVWAAGDIACFPDWRTGQMTRIEHWRTAEQQGRNAAHNMADRATVYHGVPFFWTVHHGVITDYVGQVSDYDEIVYDGSPESRQFIAYYVKDGLVLAVSACEENRRLAAIAEVMRDEGACPLDRIRSDSGLLARKSAA